MTTEEKIPVLAVVGPTASGKTGLGVMLAQQYLSLIHISEPTRPY